MDQRALLRREFAISAGWGKAELFPLVPDASFRRYFRLVESGRSAMLMDAPPECEDIAPFLTVTRHLQRIGLRPPEIFCHDAESGFILLEDLGDKTFTRLLKEGESESRLYETGIQILVKLHNSSVARDIEIEEYDFSRLVEEACLFTKWYLPAVTGELLNKQCEESYIAVWKSIYDELPEIESTLVLRDFHVDNLMMVDNECAVLDYQDALIGSPAYDVVSLLEDARRDIDESLIGKTLEKYYSGRSEMDRNIFEHHYRVWGVQRHCKVAGIFMRLWLRDDKPHYLTHLSRVMRLLRKSLNHPALGELSGWFADQGIGLDYHEPGDSREHILSIVRD